MSTFETPEPIFVTIDVGLGNIQIAASDRNDTVVEVRPSDESRSTDVKAAEQTRVEYANGHLQIKSPKRIGWSIKGWSIEVTLLLPTGSQVQAETGYGDIRTEGRLGECALKSGFGRISLDQSAKLTLNSGMGDISVGHAAGDTNVATGTGRVRINQIDGSGVIKNSNGASWVGDATGGLRLSAGNGDIVVDRAQANVEAKTANGSIQLGEVIRGDINLETSVGEIQVGIREGSAAHLDVRSRAGRVRNEMTAVAGPQSSDETVRIRARSEVGDVVIRRS